eukprot:4263632-Prymnesium_polylepis.1
MGPNAIRSRRRPGRRYRYRTRRSARETCTCRAVVGAAWHCGRARTTRARATHENTDTDTP